MNILVAVDESQAGMRALHWALGFAEVTGSTVEAVRAWAYPNLPGDGLDIPDSMDRKVHQELKAAVRSLAPVVQVVTTVLRGPAGPTLLAHIEQEHPSLVVTGRRGPDTPRTILGSVSRRIVEQAWTPVAVVSGDEHDVGLRLRNIVVGVDGSPHANRALDWATDLALHSGAALVLVNAATIEPEGFDTVTAKLNSSEVVLEEAAARVKRQGVHAETVSVPADARLAVEQVAEQRNADLVIVGTRGLGTLGKMILGSVASYLAQHVQRPVIVIPGDRPPVGVPTIG